GRRQEEVMASILATGGLPPKILVQGKTAKSGATSAPAAALRITTSQGGVCHMNSSRNAAIASAKSAALVMPAVHTGWESAASKRPTTAALTPRSMAWAVARPRHPSPNGSAPIARRDDGRDTATRENVTP